MCNTTNNYAFAIGKRIKQVFTESFLYLDGTNNVDCYIESSIRRIDTPLFLLLEDGELLRLHGPSLSVADGFLKEFVLSENFNSDIETQKAFQFMCGRTILNVQEYKVYYDYENPCYNLDVFLTPIKPDDISDIAIVLDDDIRLVCNMFFDFFDIHIAE